MSCCFIRAQNGLLEKVTKREAQRVGEKVQKERIRNIWRSLPGRSKSVEN